MNRKTPFEIAVRVMIDKPHLKGVLVTDGIIEAWLPKSQVKYLTRWNNNKETTISIPEWLAREKGFLK